jgi:hypothetical protein
VGQTRYALGTAPVTDEDLLTRRPTDESESDLTVAPTYPLNRHDERTRLIVVVALALIFVLFWVLR